jgi:hypothetical protein
MSSRPPGLHNHPNLASFARNPGTSFSPLPGQQKHAGEFFPTGLTHYATPSDTLPDMVIDSQDVDMSTLGADMMPWDLEYLPHDFMFYGDNNFGVDEGEENNQN